MSYDPLATVPAPIVYKPTISVEYLYHEVPGPNADDEVRLAFKQWLTDSLPKTATHTFGDRNRLIIGLPMTEPVVTNPGDFVVIDKNSGSVKNLPLSRLVELSSHSHEHQYVLLVHQHRRLQRMVRFTSALLTPNTVATKVKPLLNVIVTV